MRVREEEHAVSAAREGCQACDQAPVYHLPALGAVNRWQRACAYTFAPLDMCSGYVERRKCYFSFLPTLPARQLRHIAVQVPHPAQEPKTSTALVASFTLPCPAEAGPWLSSRSPLLLPSMLDCWHARTTRW